MESNYHWHAFFLFTLSDGSVILEMALCQYLLTIPKEGRYEIL